MKFKPPRFWKTLKRHPLSAEYKDITGTAWMRFTLKLKKVGYLKDRPIILHEDQVIDGWQRLRGCIETNTAPVFAELPKGIDPQEFVETVNDERRHETAEEAAERIMARRERVAEAVFAGKSKSSIAEKEGVSRPTIDKDIEKISDATGCTLEPPDGKVTGKDGKQQPATQQHPKPKAEPKKLCQRCKHNVMIGRKLPDHCDECEAIRNPKTTPPEPPDFDEPKNGKPPKAGKPTLNDKKLLDAYGIVTRQVDAVVPKGKRHSRCQDLLGMFLGEYQTWKKENA